jgi:hypothetical protein
MHWISVCRWFADVGGKLRQIFAVEVGCRVGGAAGPIWFVQKPHHGQGRVKVQPRWWSVQTGDVS